MRDQTILVGQKPSEGGAQRIAAIDGLRAIAMTMVIAQHSGLLPFGWTGVWLFYVISGYVITRGFVGHRGGTRLNLLGSFIYRRLYRIVPVYLLYIAVAFSVALIANWHVAWETLPSLLLFTFNWHMLLDVAGSNTYTPATEHLWTLSVEQQFYVVFPVMFLFLSRSRFRSALIGLIVCGPAVRLAYEYALGLSSTAPLQGAFAIYAASLCQFDAFLVGAAIAEFEPELHRAPELAGRLFKAAALVLALYCLIYVAINRANGATGVDQFRNIVSGILYGQGREIFVYTACDAVAGAILVATLLGRPFTVWMSHPALSLIGRISYGGYLFHALALSVVYPALALSGETDLSLGRRIVMFALAWTLTVAIAYVSHRWFENPIIRWSKEKPSSSPGRRNADQRAAPMAAVIAPPYKTPR